MKIRTSRVRTLRTVLLAMFSLERGQPLSAMFLFMWSFFTLSWFSNTSTDLLVWLGACILALVQGDYATLSSFLEVVKKLLIPTVFLVGTIVALYFNYRRNRGPAEIVGISPDPHRGLIVQLSPYSSRDSKYKTAQEISTALADNSLDAFELFKSNFGPFLLAARYHAAVLEHCWILTTHQSENQFPLAEKLVRLIVGKAIQCQPIRVTDPNDIGSTAREVRGIYFEDKLPSEDIIADFTGGTAAMSGGMILATLDEEQNLEYLRQDRSFFNDDGTLKDNDAIRKEAILLSPRTSREMVARVLEGR